MPTPRSETDELDFWTFAAFAHAHTGELWPGLDVEASYLVMSLHRATDVMFFDARQSGDEFRLSTAGQRIMFVLSLCGPLPMLRLAELAGMSKAATWSAVRTLVADGFVDRNRSPEDRRSNVVSITEEGGEVFDRAFRARNVREARWASVLSDEEKSQLHAILGKLMDYAGEHARRRDSVS